MGVCVIFIFTDPTDVIWDMCLYHFQIIYHVQIGQWKVWWAKTGMGNWEVNDVMRADSIHHFLIFSSLNLGVCVFRGISKYTPFDCNIWEYFVLLLERITALCDAEKPPLDLHFWSNLRSWVLHFVYSILIIIRLLRCFYDIHKVVYLYLEKRERGIRIISIQSSLPLQLFEFICPTER